MVPKRGKTLNSGRRSHAGPMPSIAPIDERHAEQVVRAGRDETGDGAHEHGAKQPAVAAQHVEGRQRDEQCRRGDQHPDGKRAHRAQPVELRQQTPNAGGRQEEDDQSTRQSPLQDGRRRGVGSGGGVASVGHAGNRTHPALIGHASEESVPRLLSG
jgi:hypothetical protein